MAIVTTPGALSAATATGRAAVLFHRTECPFSRAFAPEFRRTLQAFSGIREVEALLDDEESPLWSQFGIEVTPTVVFFEDGMAVSRLESRLGQGLTANDLREALTEIRSVSA